jgi:hypothetical protein
MNVFMYSAALFCEDCGRAIRERITAEGKAPADPADEYSYDSDEFPKGPFGNGGGEADCVQHCDSGEDCLNAIELGDGWKIGAWLENDLTAEGARHVAEAVAEGGEVAELWAQWYADAL